MVLLARHVRLVLSCGFGGGRSFCVLVEEQR
jgi:hypothetical protein